MRAIIALCAALALSGCGTTYTYRLDQEKVPADPLVSEVCPIVPDPPARGADFGEVYTFGQTMVGLYGECALRDRAKAKWIKSQGH